jgi:hypothetical protein
LVLANALFVVAIETVRRLVAGHRWRERSAFSIDYPSQAGGRTGRGSRVSPIESPSRR